MSASESRLDVEGWFARYMDALRLHLAEVQIQEEHAMPFVNAALCGMAAVLADERHGSFDQVTEGHELFVAAFENMVRRADSMSTPCDELQDILCRFAPREVLAGLVMEAKGEVLDTVLPIDVEVAYSLAFLFADLERVRDGKTEDAPLQLNA